MFPAYVLGSNVYDYCKVVEFFSLYLPNIGCYKHFRTRIISIFYTENITQKNK